MIKPDAVPTAGTCNRCGAEIEAFYVVLLCDSCLDEKLAEMPHRGEQR